MPVQRREALQSIITQAREIKEVINYFKHRYVSDINTSVEKAA